MVKLFYTTYPLDQLDYVCIAGDQTCVFTLSLGTLAQETTLNWLKRHISSFEIEKQSDYQLPLIEQIQLYLKGEQRTIETMVQLCVTDFQRQVLDQISGIPYGQTSTYGDIAAAIGQPDAARAIGGACHANPLPLLIPCHRVVGKHTLGGFGPGIHYKKRLLDLEQHAVK